LSEAQLDFECSNLFWNPHLASELNIWALVVGTFFTKKLLKKKNVPSAYVIKL
jgi:hypothetical protein